MRFRAREGAFAVLRNHVNKLGQILDISRGGLSFKYIADDHLPPGPHFLDIFLTGREFHTKSVPVITISDVEIDADIPYTSLTLRRRGLQFMELTPNHVNQLEVFLQNHTKGAA